MKFKRLITAKLLAASTFGLYLFDYRKAWADDGPAPQQPVPIVQVADLATE